MRISNKQKALAFLEHRAITVRDDKIGFYKEELYDDIARRILKGKCTKAQIKYWAGKQNECLYLNKR